MAAGEQGKEKSKDETNTSSVSTGERVNGTFMSSCGHHLLHNWVFRCTSVLQKYVKKNKKQFISNVAKDTVSLDLIEKKAKKESIVIQKLCNSMKSCVALLFFHISLQFHIKSVRYLTRGGVATHSNVVLQRLRSAKKGQRGAENVWWDWGRWALDRCYTYCL